MKHPAYPIRPNKAVDRLMLVDVLRRLEGIGSISEYTYYSLGGPFLEDFRLLYDFFPDLPMVSIENDPETFKRQKFHLPCRSTKLELHGLQTYLNRYDARGRKSIFWLDYTELSYQAFVDFMALLTSVADGSVIKLTLRAEPSDYWDPTGDKKKDEEKIAEFASQFRALLPLTYKQPPSDFKKLAQLLQDILRIAVDRTLPGGNQRCFQLVSSFRYADGVGMATFTGVVCASKERKKYTDLFQDWRFAHLEWETPALISVPFLSTKERLHLQKYLPHQKRDVEMLRRALGYDVGDGPKKSSEAMSQYADFHKYYPYLVKAIP